ncbi:MFS transporter [Roseibaca sp. Y0-43]|uniref:MFS transporter n=1 Tax=Roseibaca sp. Y0-43 TaxID=2816854 RepID=UPI001D0C5264|nr:MFS transporter [Roseibaca sp. Y0-43]MCC1480352.1 MFS transporter [Roseibaca sp. Y0-43]
MTSPRKRIWGWWAFDWANQPYNTLLLTFIFAPYFASAVAPDPVTGQALWGWMLALSGLVIAFSAPVMGAIADSSGNRRVWLLVWSAFYVAGAAALWFAVPAADTGTIWLILLAFAVGLVGLEFGIVFTNATLPDLGTRDDLGQISGTGWALGYVGGLVSLVVMLLFLAENDQGVTLIGLPPAFGLDAAAREGTRLVGPFTALWYLVFVIPFFLWVPIKATAQRTTGAVRRALAELGQSLRALPKRKSLFAYLGASLLYRDALNGIYAFGGIYAAGVLGWSIVQIGVFGILAAAVGAVACWLAGKLDSRFGPKPVIIGCVALLMAVCVIIVGTDRSMAVFVPVADGSSLPDITFYICGALIGAGGGSLQSASRTMMVRQADPARMTEGFGLYALSGKALAFLAPALVAAVTTLTDSQRMGVTPLIVLFVAGLVLLTFVDPDGEPEFRCAPS